MQIFSHDAREYAKKVSRGGGAIEQAGNMPGGDVFF
jgi:hypothetical protein